MDNGGHNRMRTKLIVLIFTLLGVPAAAGCAAQPLPSQGALLQDGSGHSTSCVAESSSGYAFTAELLRNIGAAPVKITAVSAINEKNVVLVDSFVIPVPDGSKIKNGNWPPTGPAVKDSSLQQYAKLTIPSSAQAPGINYNLVVRVGRASVLPAGFDGLRIEYTADNRQYYQITSNALHIAASC